MDVAYPVGFPPRQPGPLSRFLPPLDEGSVARVLERYAQPGELILDPFGASPRLALEAARAGFAVLVAVNNPVTRFVIQHTLQPFTISDLQTALARIAAAPKNGGRLEPFLLDLYQTRCAHCGASVVAEYYAWDRDRDEPTHKVYACDRCNFAGESPTSESDREQAQRYARHQLQHALALEQIAPSGDPDRPHAAAAFSIYPDRALYALITLVNKVEQLTWEPELQAAAQALMLSAFDAVNALWAYPEGRSRPRQLIASQRYREMNVWRALEQAIGIWALDDARVRVMEWVGGDLPPPGVVGLFPGPIRELVESFPAGVSPRVVTILPRPNQAYWTLSALWAAWLWGREAAAPIKVALRRRRYDWAWHASALRTVLTRLKQDVRVEKPLAAFVPEAEPGFSAAALAGFDGADFVLEGCAMRLYEGQAFFEWNPAHGERIVLSQKEQRKAMRAAIHRLLDERGEPLPYALVHAAAWCALARERLLAPMWDQQDGHPLSNMGEMLDAVIGDRRTFQHLGRGTEPESGRYWLAKPSPDLIPLADRVEEIVLAILRGGEQLEEIEIDDRVCQALPGLLTPDHRFVRLCLESYALMSDEHRTWRLRPEDDPQARARDCEEMERLLTELARRLDYDVLTDDLLIWSDDRGAPVLKFQIIETAALGAAFQIEEAPALVFVLPGGRAALVAEKARRDPRLRTWLQEGRRVIKFRHVRRLAAEPTLTRDNLLERLVIDPPEHHDPQLPLL